MNWIQSKQTGKVTFSRMLTEQERNNLVKRTKYESAQQNINFISVQNKHDAFILQISFVSKINENEVSSLGYELGVDTKCCDVVSNQIIKVAIASQTQVELLLRKLGVTPEQLISLNTLSVNAKSIAPGARTFPTPKTIKKPRLSNS